MNSSPLDSAPAASAPVTSPTPSPAPSAPAATPRNGGKYRRQRAEKKMPVQAPDAPPSAGK
ncbi:MAG TPA: hypothetical protein VMI53_12555 [Opitutaceae bacterium]|nr:hypothetical protein [Opitutaceae bacterium]